ncbi:MAG: hypothetical protein EPO57_09255 [Chitinophagaceae bacterium]|nr:MAG: hypothetical protein EPO57_09255 [Chitinophagaceae bacterium]
MREPERGWKWTRWRKKIWKVRREKENGEVHESSEDAAGEKREKERMTLISWNANGLVAKMPALDRLLERGDVIGVQETHLRRELRANGFYTVASWGDTEMIEGKLVEDEPRRGVQLWLRESRLAPPKILKRRGGSEVWVETRELSSGVKWVLGCVHLRGEEDAGHLEEIAAFVSKRGKAAVAVLGDFNIDLTEGERRMLEGGKTMTGLGDATGTMATFCRRSRTCLAKWSGDGVTRMGERKTKKGVRVSRSWIDHIVVGGEVVRRVVKYGTMGDGAHMMSDHLAVELSMRASAHEGEKTFGNVDRRYDEKVEEMKIRIKEEVQGVGGGGAGGADEFLEETRERVEGVIGVKLGTLRMRSQGRRKNWWFSGELQRMWRASAIAQRRFRCSLAKRVDDERLSALKEQWQEKKRAFLTAFLVARRKRQEERVTEVNDLRKTDLKKLFGDIKGWWNPEAGSSSGSSPIWDEAKEEWARGARAKELINAELVKVIQKDESIWTEDRKRDMETLEREAESKANARFRIVVGRTLEKELNGEEMVVAAGRQRLGGAPGLSGWTPKLWRTLLDCKGWRDRWVGMLNDCRKNGKFPESWTKVSLVAIPKSRPPSTSTKEWRGIALAEVGYKIYAAAMNSRLRVGMRIIGWKRKHQYGFEPGRGTAGATATLVEVWERRGLANLSTWAVFIDISKAYDSVAEELLRVGLAAAGVTKESRSLITKLYFPTMVTPARVMSEAEGSWVEADCGVRQGCTLAPALFNLVIDLLTDELEELPTTEIPGEARRINQLWYADDGVLIAESREGLQRLLDFVGLWLKRRGMRLNTKKCKVLSADWRDGGTIGWEGVEVERVQEFKYLGLNLSAVLPRKSAVKGRIEQTKKVMGMMMHPVLRNKFLDQRTKSLVAKAILDGTALFGAEVWAGEVEGVEALGRTMSAAARAMLSIPRDGGSWMATVCEAGLGVPCLESRTRQLGLIWDADKDTRMVGTVLADMIKTWKTSPGRGFVGARDGGTWLAEAMCWAKDRGIDIWSCLSREEVKMRVMMSVLTRMLKGEEVMGPNSKRPGMVTSANAREQVRYLSRIRCIEPLRAFVPDLSRLGMAMFIGLRTGSWRTAGRLWRILGKDSSNHECFCCREGDEDEDHLLWTCAAWGKERKKWREATAELTPEIWEETLKLDERTATVLNLCDLKRSMEVSRKTLGAVTEYLDAVGRRRAMLASEWMVTEASPESIARWNEKKKEEGRRRRQREREMTW